MILLIATLTPADSKVKLRTMTIDFVIHDHDCHSIPSHLRVPLRRPSPCIRSLRRGMKISSSSPVMADRSPLTPFDEVDS